jgi:hypothetical protein
MTPDDIQNHLRKHGITVHLVTSDASGVITVFLEGNLGQAEFAEYLLRQLPGIQKTKRAGAVLRVTCRS